MGESSHAAVCVINIIRVAAAVATRGVSEDEWERGGDDDDDVPGFLNLVGSEGGASAAATRVACFSTRSRRVGNSRRVECVGNSRRGGWKKKQSFEAACEHMPADCARPPYAQHVGGLRASSARSSTQRHPASPARAPTQYPQYHSEHCSIAPLPPSPPLPGGQRPSHVKPGGQRPSHAYILRRLSAVSALAS